MSIVSQVSALAARIGAEFKSVRGEATTRDLQTGSSVNTFAGKQLWTYGNSWMDAQYFINRTAVRLGFSLTNLATGGYRMQDTAMQALSPGAKTWTVGQGSGQYVLVHDLGNNSGDPDTTANRGAALESARVLASTLSAASKVESGTFTYSTTPAWNPSTAFDYPGVSGGQYAVTTNDNCWAEFPVPSGDSTLIVMGGDGVNYTTGIATVTQGGRTVATKDTNLSAYKTAYRCDLGLAPVAIKLTNMNAGTARVTFSHQGRTGGTVISAVDCLLVPMLTPPTMVWVKPNTVKDPTYGGKAALVDYLRTIPDTIADEYANSYVIDTLAGWNPDTMLGPDLLHPNPAGASYMNNALTSGMTELKNRIAVEARLAQRGVNIRWYGGKGNGTADDTGPMYRAYEAANRLGVPLLLPAGTYKVTSLPDFADRTEIIGDGKWATTILYQGTATLRALRNKQFVAFRHLQIFMTAANAKGLQYSNCFRMSFEGFLIRGNYQGDGAATYKGQTGIILDENTGGTFFNEVDIQNLGTGMQTSCIENEMVNSKFTVNYRSLYGVGGSSNAGMYLTNVEFVGGDGLGSTDVHILIDGAANSWSLVNVWLEKGDYGARIGVVGAGGPSQFGMVGCKVGARVVGLQFNACRQPYLANVQFDLDQGGTMKELEFATVNGTFGAQVIEGTALNLITTLRDDFQFADFPQYWTVMRKGNMAVGNFRSRSNIDADGGITAGGTISAGGTITAPSFKMTTGALAGRFAKSTADGTMTWGSPPVLYDTRAAYVANGAGVFQASTLLIESDTTLMKVADGVSAWTALPYINTDRYNSEVIINGTALASGYNDNVGGVLVDDAIILTGMSFRIAEPAELIGGTGNLTIQWYAGSPTALETTLLATSTLAAGQHDVTLVLATPQALTINTVLRAKITLGSTTVAGSCHVQWRGRYAPK